MEDFWRNLGETVGEHGLCSKWCGSHSLLVEGSETSDFNSLDSISSPVRYGDTQSPISLPKGLAHSLKFGSDAIPP